MIYLIKNLKQKIRKIRLKNYFQKKYTPRAIHPRPQKRPWYSCIIKIKNQNLYGYIPF